MIQNQLVVLNTIGKWKYLSILKEIQSLKENENSKNNWKLEILFDIFANRKSSILKEMAPKNLKKI